jgi:hypothetical protein
VTLDEMLKLRKGDWLRNPETGRATKITEEPFHATNGVVMVKLVGFRDWLSPVKWTQCAPHSSFKHPEPAL